MRKKRVRIIFIIGIAAIVVAGIITLAVVLSGGSGGANPCEISCSSHSGNASDCHCHGNCGTEGCECHDGH